MKYLKCLFALMMVLFFLNSCTRGENHMELKPSPSNMALPDLVSKTYSSDELFNITNFDGMIYELNAKYPIECIREESGGYRVSYFGGTDVAVIVFDSQGNKILGDIHGVLLSKSDFDHLEKGATLNTVQEIDPAGEYLFLYTGRNDTPRLSTHYTKDGYLITIEYDHQNRVSNIYEELL